MSFQLNVFLFKDKNWYKANINNKGRESQKFEINLKKGKGLKQIPVSREVRGGRIH